MTKEDYVEVIDEDAVARDDDAKAWLEQTRARATVLAEAHRLRLTGRLWWANLMFVVVPAVLSTGAAIFAARPDFTIKSIPPASVMAGVAAILLAIHKALKCDEYQDECLRLSQRYEAVATSADSALFGPEAEHEQVRKDLTTELGELARSARAQLPLSTERIQDAERKLRVTLDAPPPTYRTIIGQKLASPAQDLNRGTSRPSRYPISTSAAASAKDS